MEDGLRNLRRRFRLCPNLGEDLLPA